MKEHDYLGKQRVYVYLDGGLSARLKRTDSGVVSPIVLPMWLEVIPVESF